MGLNAKPDLTLETWAHHRALERLQGKGLVTADAEASHDPGLITYVKSNILLEINNLANTQSTI
uniref:Uncharacterized protein n=1 Tax=Leersia perrieri TaxID=77586 RepID=A0A0D9X9J4_9ORYZ